MRQMSNARLGTHDTKTRGEVRGGGKKPWRQKGTGRARQGSTRAPNWVGGGTAFGPTPRKYTKALPKKMQRLALRSALSAKAAAGADRRAGQAGHRCTQDEDDGEDACLRSALSDQSVLVVVTEKTMPVWKSANNLADVKTLLSGYINVRDLLSHDTLLLTQDAVASHRDLARRRRGRRQLAAARWRHNHASLRSIEAARRHRKDDDCHR